LKLRGAEDVAPDGAWKSFLSEFSTNMPRLRHWNPPDFSADYADAADFNFHHLRKSAKSADAFSETILAAASAA